LNIDPYKINRLKEVDLFFVDLLMLANLKVSGAEDSKLWQKCASLNTKF